MINLNKKGFEFGKLGDMLIVLAVILIVLGVVFWPSISRANDSVSIQIDSFGDCDKDGVKNFMDRCPCTSFGAKDSKLFKGCPEKVDENFVNTDKQTCEQYITHDNQFVTSCKGNNNCVEGDDGNYLTRCTALLNKAIVLPNNITSVNVGGK